MQYFKDKERDRMWVLMCTQDVGYERGYGGDDGTVREGPQAERR